MPLSEFKPQTEIVTFPGGDFKVRAASLPDVEIIIDSHQYAITSIFEKIQDRFVDRTHDEASMQKIIAELLVDVIRESPILIVNLIAILADEPDQMEAVSKLPITVQLDALTKIAKLTFTDLASVKKLAADVMTIIRGILPNASAITLRK